MTSETINGCEVFSDPCFYDMWVVRPVGCKSFNETLHFPDRATAKHAAQAMGVALAAARLEGMERAAMICDWLADEWLQSNTASVAGENCATAIRAEMDRGRDA